MRTDAQRQAEYQKRRAAKEDRVTFWLNHELERIIDDLRGVDSRTTWLRKAVTERVYRQLADVRFWDEVMTEERVTKAQARAKELGFELPS